MILFLTYHKVARQAEARSEFYTVRAEVLERQLELLERSGIHPLSPGDLLAHRPDAHPSYVLSFDDATVDHYEVVLPVLARYKREAIFFAPTSKLDKPGYLSTAEVQKLARAGHKIGLHSHEHRRLDQLGEEDIRVQMQLSKEILERITGEPAVFFAPPGGFINTRIKQLAVEAGVRVIRTMKWGYNTTPNLISLNCIPVNRHVSEMEFRRILAFRNMALIYALKQMTKTLIPSRLYEGLRGFLFRLLRRQ